MSPILHYFTRISALSQYGTVKVEGKSGILSYQVQFNRDLATDSPPTEEDLQIPEGEKLALKKIVKLLELTEKSPQEILQRVESFFQQDFRYSLQLTNQGNNSTPISAFLLDNRSGHCEYFAAATALLLRAAGIPTRYAIGYSVHEFSRLENQFIVRERNAHAWTMVYLNGNWQVLDTTPADWIGIEDSTISSWKFIFDFLSWFWFILSQGLKSIQNLGRFNHWWWLTITSIFMKIMASKQVSRVLTPHSIDRLSENYWFTLNIIVIPNKKHTII